MRVLRSLTFKIFIIILLSFILIASYGLKRDYDAYFEKQNDEYYFNTANTFLPLVSDTNNHRLGMTVNDENFQKKYQEIITVGGYTALMDENFKITDFRSTTLYFQTLQVSVEKDEKYYRYYIEINQLSSQNIKNIQNEYKNNDVDIQFEGTISALPSLSLDDNDNEIIAYDTTFYVKPTYLKVGEKVYIASQKTNTPYYGEMIGITTNEQDMSKVYDSSTDEQKISYSNIGADRKTIQAVIDSQMDLSYVTKSASEQDTQEYIDSLTLKELINEKISFHTIRGFYKQDNSLCHVTIYDLDTIEGPRYLVYFIPIDANEYTNYALTYIFQQNLYSYFSMAICMIILAFLISYMITRRIKKIDQVTCLIAQNQFNEKLEVKGHDELSSLSRHINDMSTHLDQTISQLNEEIERVKKLENLRKEFVAAFTHEIKTPLAIMNGNLELLETSHDQKKNEHYLSMIYKEMDIINSLILQMLDLSKLEAKVIELNKEDFLLEDLVVDIIDQNENLLQNKQLQVKMNVQDHNIIINADKNRIGMVIHNYLSNAIKHSLYSSVIEVTISNHQLSVYNHGEHIRDDMIDRIWLSFVSTEQDGTGLGLALCKSILDLHGYQYGVRNKDDGVEFYFQYS